MEGGIEDLGIFAVWGRISGHQAEYYAFLKGSWTRFFFYSCSLSFRDLNIAIIDISCLYLGVWAKIEFLSKN